MITDAISPDQWTVCGSDANHRRFWSTVVRASTPDNAKRVAWSHLARPSLKPHTHKQIPCYES